MFLYLYQTISHLFPRNEKSMSEKFNQAINGSSSILSAGSFVSIFLFGLETGNQVIRTQYLALTIRDTNLNTRHQENPQGP